MISNAATRQLSHLIDGVFATSRTLRQLSALDKFSNLGLNYRSSRSGSVIRGPLFLAPSIWRRLFIHALRKEIDEGPQATKFGMTIAKAPIATTENITTRHQNRLRFFGASVISI
jgi:hypothetical protein